jgi:hypothetical protein
MWRSIRAVFSGVAAITVLAIGADAIVQRVIPDAFDARGFSDNVTVLLTMLVYMTAFSGVGGWATAAVSRRSDLRDVWILTGLQLVMTLAANIAMWDRRLLWFYAFGLVLTPVAILIGGRLPRRPAAAQPATA